MSNDRRRRSLPFFALGVAFFVIGLAGQRTLIFGGVAFWLIGLTLLRRTHR